MENMFQTEAMLLQGNHGTFGPAVFCSTSDLMLEVRKEKCPLTR